MCNLKNGSWPGIHFFVLIYQTQRNGMSYKREKKEDKYYGISYWLINKRLN
jgi:hypothetical protein